ncbi:MAG TPA: hypothetical protein VI589_11705 [Vicinamibacteria bacterium]
MSAAAAPSEADRGLVRAFEECTLPADRFHHADHVRVAWLMLGLDDLPAALRRFRDGLRRYATSLGKAGIYHETITVAYLLLIHERRQRGPEDESFEGFARRNPDLLSWRPSALDRYYRPETLSSERARRTFLLPDRLEAGAEVAVSP